MKLALLTLILASLAVASIADAKPDIKRLVIIAPADQVLRYTQLESNPLRRSMQLKFKDVQVFVDDSEPTPAKLRFRGQSCVRAKRPCLALETEKAISIQKNFKSKKFDLSSLWQDDGYLNNVFAFKLSEKLGMSVFPRSYISVELRDPVNMRRVPLGLYLIMEKPDHFATHSANAEFVSRHRYKGFETKKIIDQPTVSLQDYENSLASLYQSADDQTLKGEALLKATQKTLDLDIYLRWLAMNSVLKNGDYSDEIFFVGYPESDGAPHFKLMPWDFDDLFGKIHSIPFYTESCKNYRHTPLYNCESPLDRALVSDPASYTHLLESFRKTIQERLTDNVVQKYSDESWSELSPYLLDKEITKAAEKDGNGWDHRIETMWLKKSKALSEIKKRKAELLKLINQELVRLNN